MSSFLYVYAFLPSLNPSPCPVTLAAFFTFCPPSHLQCSMPATSTAYFCLICPHCKVDCHQRGKNREEPGSVFIIVIFNVINFNFQSFLSFPPLKKSLPTTLFLLHPSWEFVKSVSLCLSFLIHSDSLSPKHLLAIIPSHVFPRPLPLGMQFSPGRIYDEIQMKDH